MKDQKIIEKQDELDKVLQIVMPDDYYKDMRKLLIPYILKWIESELSSLKEAEKEVSDPNLCCICHSNWVDTANGYDTCHSCLKNI